VSEEDKKLLLEMKDNCLNASVYDDENRLLKANAITNVLKEIERLNNIIESFEEELERESNMKEEDTSLEHNTFLDIRDTLKTVLKRFRELKGDDKE